MTDEELNAIKARLAAALPAPWTGMTVRRWLDGDCLAIVREHPDGEHKSMKGTALTVGATLLPRYGDNDTAVMLLHAREDMDALVAEVERLRVEVTFFRASVPPSHPSDYGHEAWAKSVAEGVAEGERRIVAYLRRETYPCCGQCNNQLADYIERGDHLLEDA